MTKIVLPKRETRVKLSKESIEKDWDIDSNKVPMHGIPKEAEEEVATTDPVMSDVGTNRIETVNGVLRNLFISMDITSMEDWLNFKGGASYARVYEWVENYLGRQLVGTEKQSMRHLVHEQEWYTN